MKDKGEIFYGARWGNTEPLISDPRPDCPEHLQEELDRCPSGEKFREFFMGNDEYRAYHAELILWEETLHRAQIKSAMSDPEMYYLSVNPARVIVRRGYLQELPSLNPPEGVEEALRSCMKLLEVCDYQLGWWIIHTD